MHVRGSLYRGYEAAPGPEGQAAYALAFTRGASFGWVQGECEASCDRRARDSCGAVPAGRHTDVRGRAAFGQRSFSLGKGAKSAITFEVPRGTARDKTLQYAQKRYEVASDMVQLTLGSSEEGAESSITKVPTEAGA